MNVGHVKGSGGVEPTPNRSEQVRKQAEAPVRTDGASDQASISKASQEAFRLEQRARAEEPARRELVEAARERLESGAYESHEVIEGTAKRLLGEDF